MGRPTTTITRFVVSAALLVGVIGSAAAVWGLGAQDRLSSDIYDVRDARLDPEASAIQEHASWAFDVFNGTTQLSRPDVDDRLSPLMKSEVSTDEFIARTRALMAEPNLRPLIFRGFETFTEDGVSGLTMLIQAQDGQVVELIVATDARGKIDGVLLVASEPPTGPFAFLDGITHVIAGLGLMLSGAATWLWRHRPLAGKLLLAAGMVWLMQMLELTDYSASYTSGLVAGPIAVVVVVAALLALDATGLRTAPARVALGLSGSAGALTISPLLAIDTRESSLPRQLLAIMHDKDVASTLQSVALIATLAAAAAVLAVLWRRQRKGEGIGSHVRLALLVCAAVAVSIVSSVAIWGLATGHYDLSQSGLVSLAACSIPVGLSAAAIQESRFALDGVASMVADVEGQSSRSGMQASLAQALGDPSVALVFWSPEHNEYVTPEGQPISLEMAGARAVSLLGTDDDPIGAVMHDPALLAEPERVQAATSAARLAIENERNKALAAATMRSSRARIIESAEEARRSVERDLHDGAQQRLIALQLGLTLEQQRVEKTGEPVSLSFLETLSDDLGEAILELRGLGRGLRPSVLDHGLRAAVDSLAERSSLPIVAQVTDERMPAAVESAAYFVINEAITNATRHSGADHVRVMVAARDQALCVQVVDDGVGGAAKGQGSGLQSLEDRVLALDGSWDLRSLPGEGTIVHAEFPVTEASR